MEAKEEIDLDEYARWVNEQVYGNSSKYGVLYGGCALAGEAGEVANICKKAARDDDLKLTDDLKEKLVDEIGDVLWYCVFLLNTVGVSPYECIDHNMSKLNQRRYEREKNT